MAAMAVEAPGMPTAPSGLRLFHKMRLLTAALLLSAACSRRPPLPGPEPLGALYSAAEAAYHRGQMDTAAAQAERAQALAVSHQDPFFEWRFRLLRAEMLLF